MALKYSPRDRKRLCNHQAVPICSTISRVFRMGGRQYGAKTETTSTRSGGPTKYEAPLRIFYLIEFKVSFTSPFNS